MQEIAFEALPGDLAMRLVNDAPRVFAEHSRFEVGAAWRIPNPYSTVYRVELTSTGGKRAVYAKFPRKRPVNEGLLEMRLANEFGILTELSQELGVDGPLGVVQPFAHYADLCAIVTVEAPGEPLRRFLARDARRFTASPLARQALVEYAERCGEWLRLFHECTSRGHARFDAEELIRYCRGRLAALQRSERPAVDGELADAILRKISAVADRVPASDNPVAGRHNDFATHNVIASRPAAIRVLDFSMYDDGSAYFDVCNFWMELEMLKLDPSYSSSLLTRLQQAFLESYGEFEPGDALFEVVRCRYVINRLLTTLNERSNRLITAWYRRRAQRACTRWLQAFASAA